MGIVTRIPRIITDLHGRRGRRSATSDRYTQIRQIYTVEG